jgi:deazaflavin-dependent oxidoreductase (nitroreductase family)
MTVAGRYRSLVRRIGHTTWFARLGRAVVPLDRAIQRRTRGRFTVLGAQVLPQLLLTTTGSRSGLPRTVPLLYADHDGGFVVVASNWGQRSHPAWSSNLLADPSAVVEIAGRRTPVLARELGGSERARVWSVVTEMWPAYDTYAERSGRDLRIFLLSDTRG